jgi:transcriptional regulator with XRE-family HTH domain
VAANRRVADVLREAREANGQSLRGAARELGIDASYLSRVESGERSLSAGLRARAESLYGIDGDALALSAGQVPDDVLEILQRHPDLGFSGSSVREALEARSLSPTVRPEQLSPEDFLWLSGTLTLPA